MASFTPNDPLLLAGKIVTILLQGLMAFVGVILTIVIPFILFFQDKITAEIVEESGVADFVFPGFALVGMFAVLIGLFAIGFLFFDKLRRIIGTVGEGDPFAPENADRLASMGWLALIGQLVMLPLAAIAVYLAKAFQKIEDASFTFDAGFDITGILMVLVLFILARVFRHGAAMREDLEGTV